MKFRNVSWGLFFILSAILIVLNQLGMLAGISLWNLVILLLLIPVLVTSIRYINFGGILFPLAIVGILFAEPLGIETLTPWPILGVALFLTIGLSLIFPHHYRFHEKCNRNEKKEKQDDPTHGFGNASIEEVEEEEIHLSAKFCGSVKYINSTSLREVNVSCRYAGMKIYLDRAKLKDNCVTMYLDVDFSGVEIYIPRQWKVKNEVNCMMGGIDEEGYSQTEKDDNTIILKGKAAFSGITIQYI